MVAWQLLTFFIYLHEGSHIYDIQWMGGGGQVKNSDGRGWGWGKGEEIHRNWMSRAIISISVIRVQTVF